MKRSILFIFTVLIGSVAHLQGQGILQSITTPEKAVAVVNQTLEGTWLSEIRAGGSAPTALPRLILTTSYPNGTSVVSNSDGNQSLNHGIWVRVGDRKFLMTTFLFNYDANRVLTTIVKVRISLQVSLDGQTSKGTSEAVVLDPTGRVLATVPGGTVSGVRLSPEIPADFYDFQKVQ
jgi:hypothetical protein